MKETIHYCIAVIHIQLYTYTCGNKINNNDEQTHFFRKIYLSHFLRNGCERVMCERWVGDKLQNIDPQFLCLLQHFFLVLMGCSIGGPEGPCPSAGCWFSLQHLISDRLQLSELPVAPGYIIVWHPTASSGRRICTQFNPSTVKVIPWYLRLDAPVPWLTVGSKVSTTLARGLQHVFTNKVHKSRMHHTIYLEVEFNRFWLSIFLM